MKRYVIYRIDSLSRKEVYVDMYQSLKSTLVEITDQVDEAKPFPSARTAYEWAQRRHLDYWHVGAR